MTQTTITKRTGGPRQSGQVTADSSPKTSSSRGQESTGEDVERLELLAEGFPIPTTAPGEWWAILGSGQMPRGIYRGPRRMADLPYVLAVVRKRGSSDRALYRLCMDPEGTGPTVRVYRRDLPAGEWGITLDIPLPSDKKLLDILATAIIFEGKRLGEVIDSVPKWTAGGRLQLPPEDILPAGYGATRCTEEEARQGWAEIAQRAARHPKLALTLGAGAFSPFVRPLGRQPYLWHPNGEARQGKTTAQLGAAAVMGFPGTVTASGIADDGLIKLWSSSIPGMAYALGDLGTLPLFRDELGASGLTPTKLEEVVFLIAQGGQRTVATRYTQESSTSALWGGIVFSTGNNSITGQVANAGVHARVVELSTPIVGPPETEAGRIDAEWFQQAFLTYYGWPLRWIIEGVTPGDMAGVVKAAEAALPLPVGGVSRTLGQHLAGAIAGAALLDRMTGGGDVLRLAALEAARAILDSAEGSGGESQGDILLEAILSAMADRPGAWPTKQTYERLTKENGTWRDTRDAGDLPAVGMDRKVEGVQWPDGSVVVSKENMAALAAAAGLTESTVGLRQLRDRELLVIGPSQRKAKKLENKVRLNGRIVSRYQVRFPKVEEDIEGHEGGPGGGGGGSPETPAAPGAGPVICRGCGTPVPADVADNGYHANCDPAVVSGWEPGTIGGDAARAEAEQCATAVPAPRQETPEQSAVPSLNESAGTGISAPSVTEAEEEVPAKPSLPWAVLDTDGSLILPDGSRRALPEGWLTEVRHVGDLAALLQPERIRTLYVPAPVAALFDLPEEVGPLAWNEGLEHPFTDAAEADGWDVAPAGLAHWMTIYREGEKEGNGGTIVFPAWDGSVDGWRTAGAEHVASTLQHVKRTARVDYFRTPQTTMGRLVASVERSHYRTPSLSRIEAPEVRYELAGIYAPPVGKGIDLTGKYLHMFDVNKQYASACRGTDLATAPYEHVDRPEVPKYPAPGLWRLRVDVTELRPRAGLRPVIDPARIKRGARVWDGWVPTPTMALLRDAGRKFEVLEAWVSPAKRRFLDEPMGMVTAAVAELRDQSEVEGDPEHTASVILKTAYASWVNGTLRSTFNGNRREDDPWYRPDVTAMVQAQADARKARLLIKAADIAPVHVITDETDCVVILSDDPSWEIAVPGLALDPTANGKFKHAGSAPVTDEIASILRNEKRAKSGRCVDIKDAIKAYEGGGK